MPKMKTNRGAAKRLKRTAKGKIVRRKAYLRHILSTKPRKRKRNLRRATVVTNSDHRRMERLIPYI